MADTLDRFLVRLIGDRGGGFVGWLYICTMGLWR